MAEKKESLWHVLIHLNPEWIQTILERESRGELLTPEERDNEVTKESFAFYVPYLDLRTDVNLQLRSDFHSFVFIDASDSRLRDILESDWNHRTRLQLHRYCNRDGSAIKIKESEINALKGIFKQENREKFTGIPPLTFEEVKKKIDCGVRINRPGWESMEGTVVQIHARKGDQTIMMRVAFLFKSIKRVVTFEDLTIDEVIFDDGRSAGLLSGKVLENFEREVAVLLGHRFIPKKKSRGCKFVFEEKTEGQMEAAVENRKKKELSAHEARALREDASRLRRMLSFSDITFDDEEEHHRFIALMLMCAKLLNDKALTDQYQFQIEQWLYGDNSERGSRHLTSHLSPLTSPTAAYLTIALFVATQNANLRTAVKTYLKSHSDCPPILSRLFNKVRDMEANK